MKLIIKRDQKSGTFGGKPKFILNVQVSVSPEERNDIEKYKLGSTALYSDLDKLKAEGRGFFAQMVKGTHLTVYSLVNGSAIECKDIVEMIGIEDQVKEACQNFKIILESAAKFGGEEVIEYKYG